MPLPLDWLACLLPVSCCCPVRGIPGGPVRSHSRALSMLRALLCFRQLHRKFNLHCVLQANIVALHGSCIILAGPCHGFGITRFRARERGGHDKGNGQHGAATCVHSSHRGIPRLYLPFRVAAAGGQSERAAQGASRFGFLCFRGYYCTEDLVAITQMPYTGLSRYSSGGPRAQYQCCKHGFC